MPENTEWRRHHFSPTHQRRLVVSWGGETVATEEELGFDWGETGLDIGELGLWSMASCYPEMCCSICSCLSNWASCWTKERWTTESISVARSFCQGHGLLEKSSVYLQAGNVQQYLHLVLPWVHKKTTVMQTGLPSRHNVSLDHTVMSCT